MSLDSVDDLQGAEDLIGTLHDALHSVVRLYDEDYRAEALADAVAHARTVLLGQYCRATCGWMGSDDPDVCTEDECWCPCNHGEPRTE